MVIDAPCYPRPLEVTELDYQCARAYVESGMDDLVETLARGYALSRELMKLRGEQ